MPYIPEADRQRVLDSGAEVPGDLAYLIYCLMVDWVYKQNGKMSYSRASHAIGIIETVKGEFSRQILNPYEDEKSDFNGNVLPDEAKYVAKQLRRKITSISSDQEDR